MRATGIGLTMLLAVVLLVGCGSPVSEIDGTVVAVNSFTYEYRGGFPVVERTGNNVFVQFEDGRVYEFKGRIPSGEYIKLNEHNIIQYYNGSAASMKVGTIKAIINEGNPN